MNKIKNIQALRGIAVLFVVFFHLYIVENKYSGFATLLPDTLQFGVFGVDLFFVISGFVMVTVTRGKFQNLKQSLRFLYDRLTRIYPLYWIYTLLALGVFLVQPTWINSSQGSQVNILESFLLLPSNRLPLVQVGWTIVHEMYFYSVYFLVFLFIPENFFMYAIGAWGAIVIALNIILKVGNPYLDLIFNPLTIEFLSGCLLALIYYKVDKSKLGTQLLLSGNIIVACYCWISLLQKCHWLHSSVWVVACTFIWLASLCNYLLSGLYGADGICSSFILVSHWKCFIFDLPIAFVYNKCHWQDLGIFFSWSFVRQRFIRPDYLSCHPGDWLFELLVDRRKLA